VVALACTLAPSVLADPVDQSDIDRSKASERSTSTSIASLEARLAQETGASLHVVHSWFEGTIAYPEWGLSVSAPLPTGDIAATVRAQAAIMEQNIAAHPADWHLLQPFWSADRKSA